MNILYMKYAVEVAKTGSINKAADNLYIAQPNLSRAVKELENSLGITVFKRTPKGMTLTHDGEKFIQYAACTKAYETVRSFWLFIGNHSFENCG